MGQNNRERKKFSSDIGQITVDICGLLPHNSRDKGAGARASLRSERYEQSGKEEQDFLWLVDCGRLLHHHGHELWGHQQLYGGLYQAGV